MARGVEIYRIAAKACAEQVQKALVETAKAAHQRVMQTDPRPTRFNRTVDGARGAPEERVKPFGVIVYDYPRLDEVVQFALEALFDLSPVLSGEYRNAHQLYLDGYPVRNLADYRGGEVVIMNTFPYARKIELGAMTMRIENTDQVYAKAADLVRGRFGNQAKISQEWRAASATGGLRANHKNLRYPALTIEER
jgi:hypothetical protein